MVIDDSPSLPGMGSSAEEMEWWEIERQMTPSGEPEYGVSIAGICMTSGHHSLLAAVNHTLAILAQEVDDGGGSEGAPPD